jgi:hypothetical protein
MYLMEYALQNGGEVTFPVKNSACIGYSGRNQEMVKKHIEELALEGIAPPPSIPMVYPVSNILVTQDEEIHVLGKKTSGEVEFVLLIHNGKKYVTLGSDHTDRELEAYSIPYAKQATPKPIAREAWLLDEVIDHWDELQLKCEIFKDHNWIAYQDGHVTANLAIDDILKFADSKQAIDPEGTILFCGTVPILGGQFIFGDGFRLTLTDPVLGRTIKHEYWVKDITI